MNKKISKLLLTSASAVALLAAYPSVAQNANEALGLDLPSITAEAATTAGNAFVKRVMDLPNVSTIASKTPEEIQEHSRDMRSIRRAYDRLSAAEKDATVEKWEGYLYQKERAIGNVFVDIIMDLHTIAEIEEFDTADFAAEQKAARRARNQYNDLSQVAKENLQVVKWLEYLDQKEQPLGITFVDLVGAVPNVSTLEGLTEEELEVANKAIAAAEASYDELSDAAKGDALVEKWLGYLANKKEAIADLEVIEEEPSIESVSAINAKTLEVTFNTEADVKAADFSVNKGTVKANIASVAISEDGKTATIEMTSKLTEGEYTVTVAQKDADALKASVKVENEKVSKLEIASDVAPITAGAARATVGAQVLNQYGEDITKLNHSDVTVTVGGAATVGTLDSEGVLTLTLAPLAKEGDSIFITLVHAKTGVSTQKTVKISSAAAVSEVAFGELYNKDGKTLNQDSDFTKDKFYVPVITKDQYGKEITDLTKLNGVNGELVITNTNPAVASVNTTVKTVKINNKDVNVVEVTGTNLAGSTNLIAVSKTTGANTTTTLNVEAGVKVASLNVNSPLELVTAGKDVFFPLTVIDTAGNELKTKKEYDALNAKDNITLSAGASVVEVKDKGLFVKVDKGLVIKDQPITVVITSSTGKVSTQTVIAKEAAKATVITGLSSNVATSLRAGDATGVTITNNDLVVEDQFGQVITDKEVLSAIEFKVIADPTTVFDIATVTANKSYKITAINPINPDVKSSKLSFKILDADEVAVESSTFTKTFTVVEDTQFASYEVEDVKTIYAAESDGKFYVDADYNQEIVVKAKTSAGEVVKLKEGDDFTVTGQPVDGAEVTFAKDANEAKKTVTITINRTGEQLTKELTYSNVAPKVTDFIFTATASDDAYKAKEIEDPIPVDGTFRIANLHTDNALIVTTDQYGKKDFETTVDTLTIVPSDASKVTITDNGKATASVTATAETTVTAKVKIGDVTKEIKVKLTPQ